MGCFFQTHWMQRFHIYRQWTTALRYFSPYVKSASFSNCIELCRWNWFFFSFHMIGCRSILLFVLCSPFFCSFSLLSSLYHMFMYMAALWCICTSHVTTSCYVYSWRELKLQLHSTHLWKTIVVAVPSTPPAPLGFYLFENAIPIPTMLCCCWCCHLTSLWKTALHYSS